MVRLISIVYCNSRFFFIYAIMTIRRSFFLLSILLKRDFFFSFNARPHALKSWTIRVDAVRGRNRLRNLTDL